jgi:hypothetical protein
MSPIIEYDVSDVLPFPLERDPEIEGMKPKRQRRRRRNRKELPAELEQYRLYSIEELGEFPPVAWLIDRHLAVGELTGFYGKGDTYKSFVALDWSCELARRGSPVVYIVAEGASGIRARIAAWQKYHDVEALSKLRLMPSNVNLHDPVAVKKWIEAISAQLDGSHPDLVVVDTLARNFVGGNESSPQDMGIFVEGVERIRRQLETAVLLIHHETKEGGTERGTESLRNASFAMYRFKRVNQSLAVEVTCDRMKDAEPPASRQVRPRKVELPELTADGEALVTSLVADWPYSSRDSSREEESDGSRDGSNDSSLSRREVKVLRVVNDSKDGSNRPQLVKALKVSERTISRDVKSLENRSFLEAEGRTRDRRYFVTSKGREALQRFGSS